MNVVRLFPNQRYLIKLILSVLISVLPFSGFFFIVNLGVVARENLLIGVCGMPSLAILLLVTGAILHFNSIRYEIHEDEIIVYSGFLNKSVKHVNFRNITNMELKRTFVDRALGIGSLSIQTAGSGSAIPEEKLAGLDNVQQVYEYLADQLRNYRSESQQSEVANACNTLNERQISIQILRELRAIRSLLNQ